MTDSTTKTREEELQEQFEAGLSDMTLDQFLDHVRSKSETVPPQAVELVARLDAAEAALETANEELAAKGKELEAAHAATAKAKTAAKVSPGEKAAKARTFKNSEERALVVAMRDAIADAETVEICFTSGGKEVLGLPPVSVQGDAWKEGPNGLMLTEPVMLYGPAHGQGGFSFDGFGLLIDGKPFAYRERLGGSLQVGPGGKLELRDDIIL